MTKVLTTNLFAPGIATDKEVRTLTDDKTYTHILHRATRSRGYTSKTRLRGFQTLNFALVRVGGLGLYSRDF